MTHTPAPASPIELPTSVSKVAVWLKANPDVDPAVFSAHKGQKAAARKVALRALGLLGTPDAFGVLTGYARDTYPDAELAELHRAWSRFNRRTFSAAMFPANSYLLRLDACSDLEGIGAVAGLRGLSVILDGPTDLMPLEECTELEQLQILVADDGEISGLRALTKLPLLSELHLSRNAGTMDFTPLTETPVERLSITLRGAPGDFLLQMPRLSRLLISGDSPSDAPGSVASVDPGLTAVLLKLASDGVQVVTYAFETSISEPLAAAAESAGIHVVRNAGFVALTKDEANINPLSRRLFSNILP